MSMILATRRFNISRANLQNNWDANNPNNSSSIPANNASITAWSDRGVTPNNLSQATGGNQFTYKTAVINGNNAMLLSGGQYMLGASETYAANASVSISALVQTSTIAAGTARFLSIKNGSTGYGLGRSGANAIFTTFGISDFTTPSAVFVAGTWAVLTVTFQASSAINFYLNSALVYNHLPGGSNASTATPCIGAESSTNLFWNGYLQMIVRQVGVVWNTQQRLSIERYLRNRGGL